MTLQQSDCIKRLPRYFLLPKFAFRNYLFEAAAAQAVENGAEKIPGKVIGGSYQSQSKPSNPNSGAAAVQPQNTSSSASSTGGGGSTASCVGELHKATSQISITQLSGINVNIRYYVHHLIFFFYFLSQKFFYVCLIVLKRGD
jgi:hypothetical protein